MSEANEAYLTGERQARAQRLRQTATDDLLALRDIVLNELGREASADEVVTITLHAGATETQDGDVRIDPLHDPNCIVFGQQGDPDCAAYCDPPGICMSCA